MNRFTKFLATVAVVAMVAMPARADAQLLTSTWTQYIFGALGTSTFYTLATSSAYDIWVVDCCITGDGFELFEEFAHTSLGQTSLAPRGPDPDGSTWWANPALEGGIFRTSAGITDVSLMVVRDCCGSGGVFIKAIKVVEPAGAFLIVTGVLSLLGIAYRRRDEVVT